jgi:peptide/nickel transport system ATP-binding protein
MDTLTARNLAVTAALPDGPAPVIRDLSFALAKGRILGIVGESGAGKSMIGRAIAGLLPPGFAVTGGALAFQGGDLARMPAAARRELLGRDIAFVPQEPLSALNPVLTIGRQFDEHLARLGAGNRRARRQRALAMLDAVHLPRPADLLDRYSHQLSGGMCQRVLIAMAFASRPKLLVADEPTTALDVTIQARIVQLIAQMQRYDDTSVVFITHDLRLAAQICDDILVLYAGRPAEYGPARRVFSEPAHPYTRCLQLATPAIGGQPRALYALPERMPGLGALRDLTGCLFAPRCPLRIDDCTKTPPPFAAVGIDRFPGSAGVPPAFPLLSDRFEVEGKERAGRPWSQEAAAPSSHVAACIRSAATAEIVESAAAPRETVRSDAPLLAVEGLSKVFTARRGLLGRASVAAVSNVSFTLHENEFVGIVGESGSGKSTVARLLCGLERPTNGTVIIAGRDAGDGRATYHQRAGIPYAGIPDEVQMVFQDPQSALNPRRRVVAIVTQALEAAGKGGCAERLARAEALLMDVGLPPETAMRYPAQLSGGQRQRINIARALAAVPRVLIADEIVSGLDVSVQAQLLDLLLRLRAQRGFAMLFISHDLAVVRHLCDRVLVMHRGEVVESGPVEQIFAAPRHLYTQALLAAVPPDDPAASWTAGGREGG